MEYASPLYPPLEPFNTGMLPVGDGHTLYYEQCGNPQGVPIVFLHGGPGSSCKMKHRQLFNPQKYRAILFDQRGCGKSTPTASMVANTTPHLVADIEKLRTHFGIAAWHVYGSSWGSTLGVAYAEAHPPMVLSLTVADVFLGSPAEAAWFEQSGQADRFFPEAFARVRKHLPEGSSFFAGLNAVLNGDDATKALTATQDWTRLEGWLACLDATPAMVEEGLADPLLLPRAQIEIGYIANRCFLQPNQLLNHADRLTMPVTILQGQHDMVCPPETAIALHRAVPHSQLYLVPNCGHVSNTAMQWQRRMVLDKL
ncbi:MAG: prolyl aminopeptidase [Alphaproteobacteria bacterium]